MTLEESLNEAQYIRRGDEYPDRTNLPEPSGYCGISCNQQEVRNNGQPDAYHFCKRFNMIVGCYDSCKYYLSIFDANPDLLKPFATNTTKTVNQSKKKRTFFAKLFK